MKKIAVAAPDHGGDPEVQAEEANKNVNTEKETTRQMILAVRNLDQDHVIADEIPETETVIVHGIVIVNEIVNANVKGNENDVNEKENVGNVKDVIVNDETENDANVNKNVENVKDESKNDVIVNVKFVNENDENVNVKKSNFADVNKLPKRPAAANERPISNVENARNVMIQALMTMSMTKLRSREIRTKRRTRVNQKIVLTKKEAENQGKKL